MKKRQGGTPRKNSQKGNTQTDTAKNKGDHGPGEPPLPANPTPEHPDDTNGGKDKTSPWWRRWRIWKRVLGAIGVVSGIIYAFITYLQWRDVRRNFQIDQRAWIAADVDTLGVVMDGNPLIFKVTFRNTGKTPAINARTCQVAKLLQPRTDKPYDITCPTSREGPPQAILPNSNVLRVADAVGGDNNPPISPDGKLTAPIHEDLRAGRRVAVTYGYVAYDDVFGVHHQIWYCTQLMITQPSGSVPETNNLIICPVGNAIDSNQE